MTTTTTPNTNIRTEGNLAAHLSELADEASTLFRKEIELARCEVKEGVNEMKRGVAWVGSSGAVMYAGALFLLGALALWLNRWLPIDASLLLVGLATAGAGYAMFVRGKKEIHPEHLAPRRTLRSMRSMKNLKRGAALTESTV
jgi:hypothetical protein